MVDRVEAAGRVGHDREPFEDLVLELDAGGSGNSDSTREELTHVKVGGQPSHIFQADTGQ